MDLIAIFIYFSVDGDGEIMDPIDGLDFGGLFSRGFSNLRQALTAIYYWIVRTSPLPDWLDFLLVLVLLALVVRLLITWISPRQ